MQDHEPTKKLVIDASTLEEVSHLIWLALQKMREAVDSPLEPNKQEWTIKPIDHAGKNRLEATKDLWMDRGASWQRQFNLRDED